MGDDEPRVGDRICCERSGLLTSDRGTQPLGRMADGKREGRVLLNPAEMRHRIPVPSRNGELR